MANRYDVQVKKDGVWGWAGVEPIPRKRSEARAAKKRMELEPFWKAIGVTDFRVAQTGFTTKGFV